MYIPGSRWSYISPFRSDRLESEGAHRSRFAWRRPALPVRLCQDNDNPTPTSAHTGPYRTEHLIEPAQKKKENVPGVPEGTCTPNHDCLPSPGDVFENSALRRNTTSSGGQIHFYMHVNGTDTIASDTK